MNNYPSFGHLDGERMSMMHPLNAGYILDVLPRRLYNHFDWGTLEISTEMLPSDPERGRRAMVGICHHDTREIKVATYVLYEDGSMYMYDTDRDQKFPYGMRYAHLQMLLSPESLHGWIVNDKKCGRRAKGEIGMHLEEPARVHQPILGQAMDQVRGAYAKII